MAEDYARNYCCTRVQDKLFGEVHQVKIMMCSNLHFDIRVKYFRVTYCPA